MLKRLAPYAARAMAKPTFDVDEREWRLDIAARLRAAVEAARAGGAWLEALDAATRRFRDQWYGAPRAHEIEWLKMWASTDPESLRSALAALGADGNSAEGRFAAFAAFAEEARENAGLARDERSALVTGALLNFALAPKELPLIRPNMFGLLESLLDRQPSPDASAADQYASHLRFGRELQNRLRREGVPIRDMLDVESLVCIAAVERDFWLIGPPSDPRHEDSGHSAGRRVQAPYLSICAIYRDEAPYLREWLEFHKLAGAERFFLYDNGSSDHHLDILAPYVDEGSVVLHDWKVFDSEFTAQAQAYEDCLERYRDGARWIAFLDLDEFLFSPTGRQVSEVLIDYERYPGVGVSTVLFGGPQRPDGLVTESCLHRMRATGWIKSVVDPARVDRCVTSHNFVYRSHLAVDENHNPLHGAVAKSSSCSRLRINHYLIRSEQSARERIADPRRSRTHLSRLRLTALDKPLEGERDDAIAPYVPALRRALAEEKSG